MKRLTTILLLILALAAGESCAVAWGQDAPVKIPRNQALCATVGIRVGPSHGSGTIIHAAEGHGLVVTCWHVFREYRQGEEILVDVCGPVPCVGKARALGMDQHADVAVLAFEAEGFDLISVPLAPRGFAVKPGDTGWSIGCAHSGSPIAWVTSVTAVGRYEGPDNFSTSGLQVEGRSGGGMYTHGALCGVINAADPSMQEGLYAGLRSIYSVLDRAGLQETQYRCAPGTRCETPQGGYYMPPQRIVEPTQPPLVPVTPQQPKTVKGETGPAGPQGPKGDAGPQGPRGEIGATPVIDRDVIVAIIREEVIAILATQPKPEKPNFDVIAAEVEKRLKGFTAKIYDDGKFIDSLEVPPGGTLPLERYSISK